MDSWPKLDINVKCFHTIFPTSSSTQSSALLLDCQGLQVTSDLDFPITRMLVNPSSMKKLAVQSAEKKQPPLPGYQLLACAMRLSIFSQEPRWAWQYTKRVTY